MNPQPHSITLAAPPEPTDHFLGSEHARVTLLEYGDFECPELQSCGADSETAAGALSEPDPLHISAFPAGGSAPARAHGGRGVGSRGGAGQILADARCAVPESSAPQRPGSVPLCGRTRAGSGALYRGDGRSHLPAKGPRARSRAGGAAIFAPRRRSSSTGSCRTSPSACRRCTMRSRPRCAAPVELAQSPRRARSSRPRRRRRWSHRPRSRDR